jgi:hypothetical protein
MKTICAIICLSVSIGLADVVHYDATGKVLVRYSGDDRGAPTGSAGSLTWAAETQPALTELLRSTSPVLTVSNGVLYANGTGYNVVVPPVPAQFPIVAVQDADGSWYRVKPQGSGLPLIGNKISNSPIGANWQELDRQADATNAVIAATYKQTLREVKSALATNKVEIQAIDAGTATERALKRELIDLLVEVQNLRQALARKEREE